MKECLQVSVCVGADVVEFSSAAISNFQATPERVLPVKLCKLAANNDVEGMKALLKKSPNAIALSDYDKRHALHLAAEEGHFEGACVRACVTPSSVYYL
jgi:hypothetical protein